MLVANALSRFIQQVGSRNEPILTGRWSRGFELEGTPKDMNLPKTYIILQLTNSTILEVQCLYLNGNIIFKSIQDANQVNFCSHLCCFVGAVNYFVTNHQLLRICLSPKNLTKNFYLLFLIQPSSSPFDFIRKICWVHLTRLWLALAVLFIKYLGDYPSEENIVTVNDFVPSMRWQMFCARRCKRKINRANELKVSLLTISLNPKCHQRINTLCLPGRLKVPVSKASARVSINHQNGPVVLIVLIPLAFKNVWLQKFTTFFFIILMLYE